MSKMEDKRVTFTTSLKPDILKKFKIHCAVQEKNMNEVLEQLIEELLRKEGGLSEYSNK